MNNNSQRPLFLLDIDGVTNAFDGWVFAEDEWMTRTFDKPYKRRVAPEGYRADNANGYNLLIPEGLPEWIAEIEDTGLDPVWATMWQKTATTHFAPAAGFGHDWDYIDFHSFHQSGAWRSAGMTGLGVGGYKAPGIESVAGDTPAIWIDDDLQPANYDWADRRNAAGIPTLLIQPDPRVGITREHVDQVLEFARQFETTVSATA